MRGLSGPDSEPSEADRLRARLPLLYVPFDNTPYEPLLTELDRHEEHERPAIGGDGG